MLLRRTVPGKPISKQGRFANDNPDALATLGPDRFSNLDPPAQRFPHLDANADADFNGDVDTYRDSDSDCLSNAYPDYDAFTHLNGNADADPYAGYPSSTHGWHHDSYIERR